MLLPTLLTAATIETVNYEVGLTIGSPLIQINKDVDSSIQFSDKKKQGSQKKHCCLYCKKHINKIYRHYMSVHKKENKVVEILKYPIKSAQRRSLLDERRRFRI